MYLTINSKTRTVSTNKAVCTGLEKQLAAAAASIMDCERTGVRGSSLAVLLNLLEDYANEYGYSMATYGATLSTEEIEFVDTLDGTPIVDAPIICNICQTGLNDCLHM